MPKLVRRLAPAALAVALTITQLSPAFADEHVTVDEEDFTAQVAALRADGVGFGAIVHLTNLASQLDMDALDLLETVPMVDGDFDFGEVKNRLTPEQRAALKEQARAYRELVKAAKQELKSLAADDDMDADDMDEGEEPETEESDADEGEDADGDVNAEEALKAMLMAEAFNIDEADVLAMRSEGYGWGAMFRLVSIATAMGVGVDELGELTDGDGLALGKLKKMLDPEQLEALEGGPRNFGHLMRAKKDKPAKADKANKSNNSKNNRSGNGD